MMEYTAGWGSTGRDYRTLLRSYAPLILGITALVALSAVMLSRLQPSTYVSAAKVAVGERILPGGGAAPPDMGTEREIGSSGAVASIAATNLGVPVDGLTDHLTVTVPVDTRVVQFAYSDPRAVVAQRRAEAFATAFVQYIALSQTGDPKLVQAPPPAKPGTLESARTAALQKAELLTSAGLPASRTGPNYPLNVAIGVLLGLGLGLGAALVADRMNDRVRGAADLEVRSGLPVLAVIPHIRDPKGVPAQRVVMLRWTDSAATEAYRYLRAKVLQASLPDDLKTLLVTSSTDGEGKTTTSANLAVSLAVSGRRVVLVSANLRHPDLHEWFELTNDIGLTTVLAGQASLREALQETGVEGLLVLSSGPHTYGPAELLQGRGFRDVLAELRRNADFVVIDSAPVLTVADTVALADSAEMVLLVADARRSSRQQVNDATVAMEHVRSTLIGSVLNNVGRRGHGELPLYANGGHKLNGRSRRVALTSQRNGQVPAEDASRVLAERIDGPGAG